MENIVYRTVGIVGGHVQAVIIDLERYQVVTVEKTAGECLHQFRLYLGQQFVDRGERQVVFLRQAPIQHGVFHVQFVAQHIDDRQLLVACDAARL